MISIVIIKKTNSNVHKIREFKRILKPVVTNSQFMAHDITERLCCSL